MCSGNWYVFKNISFDFSIIKYIFLDITLTDNGGNDDEGIENQGYKAPGILFFLLLYYTGINDSTAK